MLYQEAIAEGKEHSTERSEETVADLAAGRAPNWAFRTIETEVQRLYEEIEMQQGDGGVVTPVQDRAWTERAGQLAIQKCLEGRRVLLFLDDLWSTQQFSALAHVDFNEGARVLVTTRVDGLFEEIRNLHTKTEGAKEHIHKPVGVAEVNASYVGVALSDKWHTGSRAVAGKERQTTLHQLEEEAEMRKNGENTPGERTGKMMIRGSVTRESHAAMKRLRTALTAFLTDLRLHQQEEYISYDGWVDDQMLMKQIRKGSTFGDQEAIDLARALPYIGHKSAGRDRVVTSALQAFGGGVQGSDSQQQKPGGEQKKQKKNSGTNGRGGKREGSVGSASVMAGGAKADITIDLRNNVIGTLGAKALAAALPGSSVVHMDLSGNPAIDDEGWRALWAAQDKTNKQRGLVAPTGSLESPEGALVITGFAPMPVNGVIDWLGKKVGDMAFAAFAKQFAQRLPKAQAGGEITEIIMQDNDLSDAAALCIARGHMLAMPSLMKLNLAHNRITDKGCVGLAQALCGSSVQDLTLSGNQISNLGVFAICMAVQGEKAFNRDLPGGLHWRRALAAVDDGEGRNMDSDSRAARLLSVEICEKLGLNSRLSPAEVRPSLLSSLHILSVGPHRPPRPPGGGCAAAAAAAAAAADAAAAAAAAADVVRDGSLQVAVAARAKLGIRWPFPSTPTEFTGPAISRAETAAQNGWDGGRYPTPVLGCLLLGHHWLLMLVVCAPPSFPLPFSPR